MTPRFDHRTTGANRTGAIDEQRRWLEPAMLRIADAGSTEVDA